jgi:hypothetical protein
MRTRKNGKIWTYKFWKRDFSSKDTHIFVFAEQDIFKFFRKENQLIGFSNWVWDGVWIEDFL